MPIATSMMGGRLHFNARKEYALIFQTDQIIRAAPEKIAKYNDAFYIRNSQTVFPSVDACDTDIDLFSQFILRKVFLISQFSEPLGKFIHSPTSQYHFIPNGNKTLDFYQMVMLKYHYQSVKESGL